MHPDLNEKLLPEKVEGVALEENLKDRIWAENKKMWEVAAPAIFSRFSTFGISIITQAFVGHIGSTELAGYALTSTVLVRFGNGILLGMASALETLCGQSYGAKQYPMMGIYLQRSWLVLLMCTIFTTPLFIFAAPILKLLGQDPTIANMAGTISHWFIPVIFSFIVSFTCQMFLQAQSRNRIIAYLAAFTIPLHLLLSWLLTMKFKLGIPGAMISTILSNWIPNIGQLVYVLGGSCRETWHGFSMLAFKDLWPVVKLSISSGVMLCLEVWYNTVLLLLTGNMENAEVAIDALSICLNINGWQLMISLGFLAAARQVWQTVLRTLNLARTEHSFQRWITWASMHFLGGSVVAVLGRISFASTVYEIWRARNRRIFDGSYTSVASLISSITSLVVGKLGAFIPKICTPNDRIVARNWGYC